MVQNSSTSKYYGRYPWEKSKLPEEPTISLEILFYDGSDRVLYPYKPLSKIVSILQEWCVSWILVPVGDCKLSDDTWYFSAREREDNGMSWPEFKNVIKEYV